MGFRIETKKGFVDHFIDCGLVCSNFGHELCGIIPRKECSK